MPGWDPSTERVLTRRSKASISNCRRRLVMKIFRTLTLAVMLMTVGGFAARAAPVEQDISFHGSGGVVIAGTLMLPESASDGRRVPAVLLMQGSGPTDRDGNQGPAFRPDLLRQLAQVLAE